MEIIKASIDHLESVYKLLCELENDLLDKNDFSKIYKHNIKNDDVHYVLAVNDLNIIGFASLHIQKLLHHCSTIGEIQEIIVAKEQQGLGVGAMLFEELKKIATTNKCIQLEVCCNLARENSHKFYLKQGMKKSHYKFTYRLA